MTPAKAPKQGLRIGIVGCGKMGRIHALNCSQIKGASVVALADVDISRAEALALEVNATPYNSIKEMTAKVPLDAIVSATPPKECWEIVQAATAAQIPLFIEKPFALDLATAKACRAAVEKGAIINAVGFQLRFSPLTLKAKDLLSGQQITHVRTACTTPYYLKMDMPPWYLKRQHSGGPFLEQACHMIDMARFLVGDISYVFAQGKRLVCQDHDGFDSEDTLILAYQFESGALGTDTNSCASLEFNWEIELFGPSLRLLIDYARKRLGGYIGEKSIDIEVPDIDLHRLEVQAFLLAVSSQKRDSVLSDFADATKTLAVLLTGNKSLKTSAWEPLLK